MSSVEVQRLWFSFGMSCRDSEVRIQNGEAREVDEVEYC